MLQETQSLFSPSSTAWLPATDPCEIALGERRGTLGWLFSRGKADSIFVNPELSGGYRELVQRQSGSGVRPASLHSEGVNI